MTKQVPDKTISDECKWCAEGEPEWSTDAQCWIHRRSSIDKRCLRKHLSPIGEYCYDTECSICNRVKAFKDLRQG